MSTKLNTVNKIEAEILSLELELELNNQVNQTRIDSLKKTIDFLKAKSKTDLINKINKLSKSYFNKKLETIARNMYNIKSEEYLRGVPTENYLKDSIASLATQSEIFKRKPNNRSSLLYSAFNDIKLQNPDQNIKFLINKAIKEKLGLSLNEISKELKKYEDEQKSYRITRPPKYLDIYIKILKDVQSIKMRNLHSPQAATGNNRKLNINLIDRELKKLNDENLQLNYSREIHDNKNFINSLKLNYKFNNDEKQAFLENLQREAIYAKIAKIKRKVESSNSSLYNSHYENINLKKQKLKKEQLELNKKWFKSSNEKNKLDKLAKLIKQIKELERSNYNIINNQITNRLSKISSYISNSNTKFANHHNNGISQNKPRKILTTKQRKDAAIRLGRSEIVKVRNFF